MRFSKIASARWFRAVDLPSTKPQIFGYKPQRVPQQFEAFSKQDSARIEQAWQRKNSNFVLVEKDGLLTVDLQKSLCIPTYWDGPGFKVFRALWFEVLGNNKVIPIDKTMEDEIEKRWHEYRHSSDEVSQKSKSFDLPWEGDPDRLVKCEFQNDILTVMEKDSWLAIFKRRYFFRGIPTQDESESDFNDLLPSTTQSPNVTKGTNTTNNADTANSANKFNADVSSSSTTTLPETSLPGANRKVKVRPEYQPRKIKHLVFCVHGIGQLLSIKFEQVNFIKDVDELRSSLAKAHKQLIVKNPMLESEDSGIQVIPVMWRHKLKDEINGLKPSQLFGSSNLAADAVLDFVMYTSGEQRQHIQQIAAEEMRKMFSKFCEIHPEFAKSPKVSVVGHSLGAVIAYDLICRKKQDLGFEVENLFTLGSPLGVLELMKREPLKDLGQAKALYNIMRLADPVATRLEPLVTPKSLEFVPKPLEGGGTNLLKQFRELADDIVTQSEFLASKASSFFRIMSSNSNSKPEEPLKSPNKPSFDLEDLIELKKFNRHGRLDFSVQESIDISLILGLAGHLMYLDNPDVVHFILKELINADINKI